MSRKIVTWAQFKEKCGVRMMANLPPDSCEASLCDAQSCPAFSAFSDAEPIIEAAREEWSRLNFLGRKEELENLSEALADIGELKFKEAACASKN